LGCDRGVTRQQVLLYLSDYPDKAAGSGEHLHQSRSKFRRSGAAIFLVNVPRQQD
jgi:hypothetical protein